MYPAVTMTMSTSMGSTLAGQRAPDQVFPVLTPEQLDRAATYGRKRSMGFGSGAIYTNAGGGQAADKSRLIRTDARLR